MSKAPQRSPSSFCTVADVAGTVRSGVVVARTRASIDSTSSPDIASAARPASAESPAVVPPTWRSRMPVRSMIHSSLVSSPMSARSWLVSTFGGSAVPHPVMTAPRAFGRVTGIWGSSFGLGGRAGRARRAEPGDRLAGGHPLGGNGDVALQRAGERRADLVLADVTEHRADRDQGAVAESGRGGEHAGRRTDDEALAGEEVLALELGGRRRRVGPDPFDELVEVLRRGDRDGAGVGHGALRHPAEHTARSELGVLGDAEVLQLEQAVLPAHG